MWGMILWLAACGPDQAEATVVPPVTRFVTGWANDFCPKDAPCRLERLQGEQGESQLLIWGRSDTRKGANYTYLMIERRNDGLGDVQIAYRTGRNLRPPGPWTMEPAIDRLLTSTDRLQCGEEDSCALWLEQGDLIVSPKPIATASK